ncbi:putative F-box protein At3g52320 isoform X2 [Panicum virgatum]|uniref:putative F-box protein At3g52320 isoform X2 n=1 Tax=Panicum virgatum TaxID=38727 RepID=UPI0019D62E81|nr:putative F-box protein At3g52320 isoform X2 [Panicum virgatum]
MDHPKRSTAAAPSLPDDALVEILSRLPAKSLCRFKCVSRAWRDLIADRLRCNRLPQTLEGFYVFDGDDETQGGSSDAGGVSPDRVVHGRFINALGKSSPLASFSFMGKQPGIEEFGLLRSCNGLLLFGHRRAGDSYDSLGYIVCNPATEQWVAVPSSGWKPLPLFDELEDPGSDSDTEIGWACTYLIFNPAVSKHFQLVEFISDDYVSVVSVEEEVLLLMACCTSVSPAFIMIHARI